MTTLEILQKKAQNSSEEAKIAHIILSITGKGVKKRRIEALEAAGYKVSPEKTKWNFGSVGVVKPCEGGFNVQIGYATSGKARNGYGVNACPVVTVKQQ